MAYNDRSLERSFKFVKLSFNEEEGTFYEDVMSVFCKGHPSALARKELLKRLAELVHDADDSVVPFAIKQRAEQFLAAA